MFEFFLDPSQQVKCWQFLRNNIKANTVLVTVPSLEDSLKTVAKVCFVLIGFLRKLIVFVFQTEIDFSKWVLRQEIREPLLAMSVEDSEELSEICVYRVI